MKTLGIIGGLGPESTIEYYRLIQTACRERGLGYPAIIINSIDLDKLRGLIEADQLNDVAAYLADEVKKLSQAGAVIGLLAANTPHIVFDQVQERSAIPLLSIVEVTCEAVKAQSLKRVGLLGTRFTMQGRFYFDVFTKAEIELIVPEPTDQNYVHEKYMGELVFGVVRDETREQLLSIVERMKQRDGIQAIILGGTELSLILRGETACRIPLFDTTRIHVEAAVKQLQQ